MCVHVTLLVFMFLRREQARVSVCVCVGVLVWSTIYLRPFDGPGDMG